MIIGSTPTHIFSLPFHTNVIQAVLISYAQKHKVVLRKRTSACELTGTQIITKLSEKGTFCIEDAIPSVDVRIKIKLITGDVVVSKPIRIAVEECFDEEEVEVDYETSGLL